MTRDYLKLKGALIEAGLPIADLACGAGLSFDRARKIVRGTIRPRSEDVARLLSALHHHLQTNPPAASAVRRAARLLKARRVVVHRCREDAHESRG